MYQILRFFFLFSTNIIAAQDGSMFVVIEIPSYRRLEGYFKGLISDVNDIYSGFVDVDFFFG